MSSSATTSNLSQAFPKLQQPSTSSLTIIVSPLTNHLWCCWQQQISLCQKQATGNNQDSALSSVAHLICCLCPSLWCGNLTHFCWCLSPHSWLQQHMVAGLGEHHPQHTHHRPKWEAKTAAKMKPMSSCWRISCSVASQTKNVKMCVNNDRRRKTSQEDAYGKGSNWKHWWNCDDAPRNKEPGTPQWSCICQEAKHPCQSSCLHG